MKRPLRIGLPKGRLLTEVRELFGLAGFDLSAVDTDARRLVHPVELRGVGPAEVLLLRGSDVGVYVAHGVCAIGVLGSDVLREQRPDVLTPIDLGLGRCRMCLAAPKAVAPLALENPRVATKYPKVAAEFFVERGSPAEIITLSGAIEVAPLVGLADAIVDIVQTGETLKQNGLTIRETLFDVSARLVINRAALHLRMDEVREIQLALTRAVQNTRDST